MRKALPFVLMLLPGLGLGAGCGIPKEQYNQQVRDNQELKTRLSESERLKAETAQKLADLEKQDADLKQRIAAMSGDIGKAESDKATLNSDLAAMKKSLEDLKRAQVAAEKRTKAFRDLVAKFKAMVDAGKLAVEIRNGLMLVKLPDNILFDTGKTDLKKEGMDAISQVTKILNGVEGRKFQVAGHTDNQPLGKKARFRSNWELSTERALTVVNLMIKEGMDPKRLSAAGYADVLPVAANDDDEGRRKNRRIEIVLVPNIEDLPPMDDIKN